MCIKKIICSLIGLSAPLLGFADHCAGKLDVGPVYIHVNVLESGHTVKNLDMGGLKVNGTVMLYEGTGFCVKPDILYATGHGELIAGAFGFGHVTPINDSFCVTPSVGVNMSNLRTSLNVSTPYKPPLPVKVHLRDRFRSLAPYIALDVNYTIWKGLRVCGNIQYSWSRTHTRIQGKKEAQIPNVKTKGNSKGPSYALMLEQDLSDEWSLHLGGAYNTSLSHEKHGLRGYGFKLGLARWF